MGRLPAQTTTRRPSPALTDRQYIELQRYREQLYRRHRASLRLEPYEHRPWDRGFNIHMKECQ